jgi:phosphatidylglycerophosphatase GEP4
VAIPHLHIDDLRQVDWAALKQAGFEGCIFDKDNTLTEPYRLELRPSAAASLEECRAAFGNEKIVLYSNSAGLEQFDPQGVEAEALEEALGVAVLRHKEKKPAGGAEDVEKHFGYVQVFSLLILLCSEISGGNGGC